MPGSSTLSPDAFADAFTASGRTLWCVAAAVLGRRDGAEDVLQEAAVIALAKLADFDSGTSFVAWMSQIVRFVALNQARRQQRSPLVAVPTEVLADSASDCAVRGHAIHGGGDLAADQADFDDAVVHALAALGETARACILLRTVMELPHREIARILSIPEGTVMSHVHRSRATLRQMLARRCEGRSRGHAGGSEGAR